MTTKLDWLNNLPPAEAEREFAHCCGATRWARTMAAERPFASADRMQVKATECFLLLEDTDWLEAFSHHPLIGDVESLRAKYAANRTWSTQEQARAMTAADETLEALARGNREYKERFGHIFIVFATGKSADEMLALLNARIHNDAATELRTAAAEQRKITRLRLEKLIAP